MIALITGASSGIGRAMALNFAEKGINLILTARRKERLTELKKEIQSKFEIKVKIIQKDLSDVSQCKELYEEVKSVKPDFVINNAGFGVFGGFTETALERELEMIDVNIKSVHILTKLFLKDFKERNYGYILNVASVAGFMAGPYFAGYYASKNYVLQLTKAIYEELRAENINVYVGALCPGPVDTEFNKVAGANLGAGYLSDKEVADYAIEQMFLGKLIIIPGNLIKAAAIASRLVPTKLFLSATRKVQKARSDDE